MYVIYFLVSLLILLSRGASVYAVNDPLSFPNNKIGIHILFPTEIHQAAKVINNENKSAWGYVTIPIQSTDRDRQKWQEFFNKCLEEKVIPIMRIATVTTGSNWDEPNSYDLIDFANFLNDLKWPIQNRYVIIFNEVNRPDEFGGHSNPEKYADILNNAVDIFKARSADFFILPAGLDNAAITRNGAIYWKTFLTRMYNRQPEIFNKIDGWNSHAYPNPDFSVRPDQTGSNKIDSFRYDLKFLTRLTKKLLPVFITETGWSDKYLSDVQISYYYKYAFSNVWSDKNVAAVTPFLLNAQEGPFKQFSFTGENQSQKVFSQTISDLSEIGNPAITRGSDMPVVVAEKISTATPEVLGTGTDSVIILKKLYNNLKSIIGLLD